MREETSVSALALALLRCVVCEESDDESGILANDLDRRRHALEAIETVLLIKFQLSDDAARTISDVMALLSHQCQYVDDFESAQSLHPDMAATSSRIATLIDMRSTDGDDVFGEMLKMDPPDNRELDIETRGTTSPIRPSQPVSKETLQRLRHLSSQSTSTVSSQDNAVDCLLEANASLEAYRATTKVAKTDEVFHWVTSKMCAEFLDDLVTLCEQQQSAELIRHASISLSCITAVAIHAPHYIRQTAPVWDHLARFLRLASRHIGAVPYLVQITEVPTPEIASDVANIVRQAGQRHEVSPSLVEEFVQSAWMRSARISPREEVQTPLPVWLAPESCSSDHSREFERPTLNLEQDNDLEDRTKAETPVSRTTQPQQQLTLERTSKHSSKDKNRLSSRLANIRLRMSRRRAMSATIAPAQTTQKPAPPQRRSPQHSRSQSEDTFRRGLPYSRSSKALGCKRTRIRSVSRVSPALSKHSLAESPPRSPTRALSPFRGEKWSMPRCAQFNFIPDEQLPKLDDADVDGVVEEWLHARDATERYGLWPPTLALQYLALDNAPAVEDEEEANWQRQLVALRSLRVFAQQRPCLFKQLDHWNLPSNSELSKATVSIAAAIVALRTAVARAAIACSEALAATGILNKSEATACAPVLLRLAKRAADPKNEFLATTADSALSELAKKLPPMRTLKSFLEILESKHASGVRACVLRNASHCVARLNRRVQRHRAMWKQLCTAVGKAADAASPTLRSASKLMLGALLGFFDREALLTEMAEFVAKTQLTRLQKYLAAVEAQPHQQQQQQTASVAAKHRIRRKHTRSSASIVPKDDSLQEQVDDTLRELNASDWTVRQRALRQSLLPLLLHHTSQLSRTTVTKLLDALGSTMQDPNSKVKQQALRSATQLVYHGDAVVEALPFNLDALAKPSLLACVAPQSQRGVSQAANEFVSALQQRVHSIDLLLSFSRVAMQQRRHKPLVTRAVQLLSELTPEALQYAPGRAVYKSSIVPFLAHAWKHATDSNTKHLIADLVQRGEMCQLPVRDLMLRQQLLRADQMLALEQCCGPAAQ
ncbi:MAG: hypothetical protein MHM6MM_005391 [Cercozoa sp. M6MM]